MRYEVVESWDSWIVRRNGDEVARYADQESALNDLSQRMKRLEPVGPVSLTMRYRAKAG